MKKIITCLLAAVILFSLAACNGDKADYTIRVGESGQWTPFEDASGVAFSNSDDTIISITDDGQTVTFTGLAVGKSTITATFDGKTSTAVVAVESVAGNPGETSGNNSTATPSNSQGNNSNSQNSGTTINPNPSNGENRGGSFALEKTLTEMATSKGKSNADLGGWIAQDKTFGQWATYLDYDFDEFITALKMAISAEENYTVTNIRQTAAFGAERGDEITEETTLGILTHVWYE